MPKPVAVQPPVAEPPQTERPSSAPPAVAPARVPVPEHEIRRSLRISIKDGMAWSFMIGAGQQYVGPFIILQHTGVFAYAAIAALPNLLGAIVQIFMADVVDRVGRRKIFCTTGSFMQAATWLPFCIGMFLPEQAGYFVMLFAFAAYHAFGNFGSPAWASLMGDLVPEDRRGRYYGLRNVLVGSTQIVSTLAAGYFVKWAIAQPNFTLLGLSNQNSAFLLLFALSGVMRAISGLYISRMYEPAYHRDQRDHFTLWEFIRRAPRAHFGRFVIYNMLLNIGQNFVGPYFSWYMLGHLKFTPFAFACIIGVQWIFYFSFITMWGRLADRFGSKRILSFGGFGLAFIPLLLFVSDSFWWFAAVQVYDGLVGSAYNIAAWNYIFDVVTPPKRARCSAYYALFAGVGTTVGIFAGAAVLAYYAAQSGPVELLGLEFSHPFKLLCIIGVVLRLLPSLLLLRSFAEFRLSRPVFFSQCEPT